jgi:hypothetical protein
MTPRSQNLMKTKSLSLTPLNQFYPPENLSFWKKQTKFKPA